MEAIISFDPTSKKTAFFIVTAVKSSNLTTLSFVTLHSREGGSWIIPGSVVEFTVLRGWNGSPSLRGALMFQI
jgi:hypothetical protein